MSEPVIKFNNFYSNYCNINMKKGQQRGQIQFRPNSILNHPGIQQDILVKHPNKYLRGPDGQIVRVLKKENES